LSPKKFLFGSLNAGRPDRPLNHRMKLHRHVAEGSGKSEETQSFRRTKSPVHR